MCSTGPITSRRGNWTAQQGGQQHEAVGRGPPDFGGDGAMGYETQPNPTKIGLVLGPPSTCQGMPTLCNVSKNPPGQTRERY